MPGGRPTDDPKTKLVAVRLAPRQVRWLERQARREGVTLSEALRRVLEEAAGRECEPKAVRRKPSGQKAATKRRS